MHVSAQYTCSVSMTRVGQGITGRKKEKHGDPQMVDWNHGFSASENKEKKVFQNGKIISNLFS